MESTVMFKTDDGEEVVFTVISETRLNETNYLLVTDGEDSNDCYLLKEMGDDASDMVYEMVEDEKEIDAVFVVFSELLEDILIEKE